MYSNPAARKSVDSLSSLPSSLPSPTHHRGDFPFHRQRSTSPYNKQRRGSTASSIYSVSGALESSLPPTLAESGQNAISTLLQPPIVRTGLLPHTSAPASSLHKPPTARDIPPVTLTNIPHVDATDFGPYLTQVGALFDQLRKVKESEEHNQANRGGGGGGGKQDEPGDTSNDSHLKPRPSSSRKTSLASIPSFTGTETPSAARRSSSGFNRRAAAGPPPLSTIPNVYFDDDFHLENPRTFDVVSERSEVVRPAPGVSDEKPGANGSVAAPRKALATNAILQEKLSWYMDTVEMHLINSISTASTTFFTALGSLRELHEESAECVSKIKVLRQELCVVDDQIAKAGLDTVQKRRRRENLQQLHEAVQQLQAIVKGVADCEELVERGEVEKALNQIDSLEFLIAGEQEEASDDRVARRGVRLHDLRDAVALQDISSDIATLQLRIGRVYEKTFLEVLRGDLKNHRETVSKPDVLLRWNGAAIRGRGGHVREPSAFPSYMASTTGLRKQLLPTLRGLDRSKHISVAAAAYRDALLKEVRGLVKDQLPSANDDDNESMMSSSTYSGGRHLSQQERSSILARNLRALEPGDAEEMLVNIYVGVTETLRRLMTQVKVLLDVTSSMEDGLGTPGLKSPPMRSPLPSPAINLDVPELGVSGVEIQEEIHKALDMSNLLGQAIDIALDRIVKVLRVRSEQSCRLSLTWFLRYFTLNLHFANECESISGRGGTALKTVVNSQIKEFIQKYGDGEKQKLATGMESDQWNATTFGEPHTEWLNQILECSTRDPESWTDSTRIHLPHSEVQPQAGDDEDLEQSQTNGTGKEKTQPAVIESEEFVLPNSAFLCLDGMTHFLQVIATMPSMSIEIASSLIAYLQLFNSRCTQLILGAGATRSAGLKNITTKHLALASQALSFIATLIPYMREFVRRHAAFGPTATHAANLMVEFDKVRRLYQEHQNSIYDKVVEMMSGRASAQSKVMKAIDWDGDGADAVHPYMEKLAKETGTLYRVLGKHLPESIVHQIMVPVFASYRDQVGQTLNEIEPEREAGRQSMIRDIEYFTSRLGKIDGFGDLGDHLLGIVKAKEIAGAVSAEPERREEG